MTTTTTGERPAATTAEATVADALEGTVTPDPQAAMVTSGTGNAAMVLRDDQTAWTPAQLAMLQAMGVGEDVLDAELQLFLYECQRRRLDPFAKQIYLIGRNDRQAGRKVYRSQVSIDGFRLIARRAADQAGVDYGYEDTLWYDRAGREHKIWLTKEPPAGAKVVVLRNGMRYDAEARFEAYAATFPSGDLMAQWATMGDVMIAKCAEALALRKAFPEDLGGLYTVEEMEQADNVVSYQFPGGNAGGRQQGQQGRGQAAARGGGSQRGRGPQGQRPQHNPDPAAQVNQKWLNEARGNVPTMDDAALGALVEEGKKRYQAGALTAEDAAALSDLIAATRADLHAAALKATQLDPEDPWYDAVEGIRTQEDAVSLRTQLTAQRRRRDNPGGIDNTRYQRVMRAINGRAQMLRDTEAAQVQTSDDGVVQGTVEEVPAA